MKITVPTTLNSNDFPGENDNFYRLLSYFQQHRYETIELSRNKITFEDNLYIQLIEYKFTHGVQALFSNTIKTKPRGILPVYAENAAIDAWEMDFYNTGQFGVTMYFKQPKTNIFLTRNANQSIADSMNTAIVWTTANIQDGKGLTWVSGTNPSRVTCSIPGTYLFSYTGAYESNVANLREFWISKNGVIAGTATRFATNILINSANIFQCTGSTPLSLVAGDYVELWTFQNSAGALNALGNGTSEVQLMAHSLEYSIADVPCVIYILG